MRFRRVSAPALLLVALVVLAAQPADAGGGQRVAQARAAVQTHRTFVLGPGRAWRWFTFRERRGVILLNRITASTGVRAFVDARIPHLAGARVWSWPLQGDPSLSCRQKGTLRICTQGEEWCPMPEATWHFHLFKLSGPAGSIRFDFVVAPPPAGQ
jgi:hypothetical protein